MRRPDLSLRHSFHIFRLLLATALSSVGCYSAGDGQTPPEDRIYFPVGLTLVNESKHLLVANSDFDLQYNAGTLNVLDVARLAPLITVPCSEDKDCTAAAARCTAESGSPDCNSRLFCNTAVGLCVDAPGGDQFCGVLEKRPVEAQLLSPGACAYIEPAHPPEGAADASSPLLSEVQIGAFATDVVYRERPASADSFGNADLAGRAFIPVRGDATLHWVDVSSSGALDCGQQNGNACDDLHRAGNHEEENTRDLRLASEPFAVDASPDGAAVMVTNQTTGAVSLFVNDWNPSVGASLQFAVTGLPTRPIGIAALPTPAYIASSRAPYPPGFLVTFRNAPEIDLLRYYNDENRAAGPGSAVARPYAARTAVGAITVNSVGTDSRGIAVDSSKRSEAESDCARHFTLELSCIRDATCVAALDDTVRGQLSECLNKASATPLDVFVANRTPATLLLGRTDPVLNALESTEIPRFYDSLPLTLGPSRVVVGNVVVGVDDQGKLQLERRVFVVCFDSRRIFVYDPERRRLDAEIMTGRGPHALAIDEQRGWLFVGHFTDSFISVVSLDRRFPKSYATTLAIIGKPTPPRASK